MKKIVVGITLLIILCFAAIRLYPSDVTNITSSYSQDTQLITISLTKPHTWFDPHEYEVRGDSIVSFVGMESNGSTDLFHFSITDCGATELIFFTNNPREEHDMYKHSHKLDITITQDVIDLGGRLWKR